MTAVPVLSPVSSLARSSSRHPAGVEQWRTARSSPGTVVVTVLLRPTLCPSVDSPQLGVADRGFVVLATDVRLVGVDTEGTSLLSITLGTADRAAVGEPVTGLTIFP